MEHWNDIDKKFRETLMGEGPIREKSEIKFPTFFFTIYTKLY